MTPTMLQYAALESFKKPLVVFIGFRRCPRDKQGLTAALVMLPYAFRNFLLHAFPKRIDSLSDERSAEGGEQFPPQREGNEFSGGRCNCVSVLGVRSEFPDFTSLKFLVNDIDTGRL
jgi:hypothetical protein